MWKLLLRIAINTAAIWAASGLIAGITLDTERVGAVIAVALVFGIVNSLLSPIVKFLSLPFIILTLGIFTLIVNAGLLGLTAYLTDALTIDGFWPAFWGAIVVGVVSWLLGLFLTDDDDE